MMTAKNIYALTVKANFEEWYQTCPSCGVRGGIKERAVFHPVAHDMPATVFADANANKSIEERLPEKTVWRCKKCGKVNLGNTNICDCGCLNDSSAGNEGMSEKDSVDNNHIRPAADTSAKNDSVSAEGSQAVFPVSTSEPDMVQCPICKTLQRANRSICFKCATPFLQVEETVHTESEGRILRVTCISGPIAGTVVTGEAVYLGRNEQLCQMVFPDVPGVSNIHCMLHTDGREIEERDLRSKYGNFFADGTRLAPDKSYFMQSETTLYLGSYSIGVSIEII